MLALGEFVQAGDGELKDDHHQDHRGHRKNWLQVDANGAAHEADAEEHGEADAEDGAEGFEDAGCIEPHNAVEQEDRLDAFAEDHEEDEGENAPAAPAAGGILLQTSFNFAFHVRRRGGSSR